MPRISNESFSQAIISAIENSGGSAQWINPEKTKGKPLFFAVNYERRSFNVCVYIWTLTHGGGQRSPNEYRIQMTGVRSPIPLNPHEETILLGYLEELDVFAGFDLSRHLTFTDTGKASPSIQISRETLVLALQDGLSFHTKDNAEIAIGIRPDHLAHYILNASDLHVYENEAFLLIQIASQGQESAVGNFQQRMGALAPERQRTISQVSRIHRDYRFRKTILSAYENRCAVTKVQLKLVDAAHILPVAAPGSTDLVTNGIALSPTMHRAYDNGLIFLHHFVNETTGRVEYRMRINPRKLDSLRSKNIGLGIEEIGRYMDELILLPSDNAMWPDIEMINQANAFRGIH
ncbi:MAG: HNH endonuclease [Myxococcales bacterium]|nr:HNH endonuclease [Myxococcales bacterium]